MRSPLQKASFNRHHPMPSKDPQALNPNKASSYSRCASSDLKSREKKKRSAPAPCDQDSRKKPKGSRHSKHVDRLKVRFSSEAGQATSCSPSVDQVRVREEEVSVMQRTNLAVAGPSAPICRVHEQLDKNGTESDVGVDEDELNDLRTAMARSLEEKEIEAKAFVPLCERNPEELLDYFENSLMVCKLLDASWFFSLFEGSTKIKFVSLLERERQCNRWYCSPGTEKYFMDMSDSILETMNRAHLQPEERTKILQDVLEEKTVALVEGYSKYPEAPGMAPAIFASNGEEFEVIDLT